MAEDGGAIEDSGALVGVDAETLEPLVRELLGEPAAVVARGWSCHPLRGGGGEGIGLYRLTGSAWVGRATRAWALILKVGTVGTGSAADGGDPAAWDYPAREGRAYESGWLEALPGGLAVPRCLAVAARPDGTSWLWLEAVTDEHPGPWPLGHYTRAARHLGRFNGAYLATAPLPDEPWLSRRWLRGFVAPSGPALAELAYLAGPGGPPLLQQLYPPPVVAELRRLWAEREIFLAALDRLPQTLCHHDAFRRNLLDRAGPQGSDLVTLDWAYVGHGAVGEELVPLVVGSLFFFEAAAIAPHELDTACFTAYVAGLREAGWAGDDRLVRLGFTAAAALRYTVGTLRLVVPEVADPTRHPAVEAFFGRSLGEVVAAWTDLWGFQLWLAEEARTLVTLARP